MQNIFLNFELLPSTDHIEFLFTSSGLARLLPSENDLNKKSWIRNYYGNIFEFTTNRALHVYMKLRTSIICYDTKFISAERFELSRGGGRQALYLCFICACI